MLIIKQQKTYYMDNFDKTISYFFQILNNVKLYHWQTTSFARHKATDEFVSELQDLVDSFVEVYMGRYSRPSMESKTYVPVQRLTDEEIVVRMKQFRNFLQKNVSNMLSPSDTELLNIRDEMLSLVNKTMYLFSLN